MNKVIIYFADGQIVEKNYVHYDQACKSQEEMTRLYNTMENRIVKIEVKG